MQDRRISRPLLEIVALLIPPLAIMWITPVVQPVRANRLPLDLSMTALTLAVAVTLNLVHGEGLRDLGIRVDNFGAAVRRLGVFVTVATLVLIAVGCTLGSVRLGNRFAEQLAVIPIWGFLQQYGVQGIVNRRLQAEFGNGQKSIVITALVFALLHAPNPALMVATLIAGYFWAATFQATPNLLALALSHAWLSALLANCMPVRLLPNMKVGLGFW